MPDFVNTTTLAIVASVNDAAAPWQVITRAEYDAATLIAQQYRKWTGSAIVEMSAGEKAAVDAAVLTAERDSRVADRIDNVEDVLRATLLTTLDELNAHAAKMNAILAAIDASTNLTNLKSGIAAIADYPTRTTAQLRNSIRNKLGS